VLVERAVGADPVAEGDVEVEEQGGGREKSMEEAGWPAPASNSALTAIAILCRLPV